MLFRSLHGVEPDINFKRIGFPKAKRPILGVRKTFVSRVTSGAKFKAKAMTFISACIETAKYQAAL